MGKKIFFDVGANNGSSSIHVAENNRDTIVYAFEPTPELFFELRDKTKHLENYVVIPKAVSNFKGRAEFYIAGQRDWGCSSLLHFSPKSMTAWPGRTDFKVTNIIDVEVITLEDFMIENNINKIDFLHIDTQGSDLNVLKGLGRKINCVSEGIMEAANVEEILYYGQNTKKDSVQFLQKYGFRIHSITPNDSENNEINISFKKGLKIKQYIVTYNNSVQINKCLKSIFDSLDEIDISLIELNVINNHSNLLINEEFLDKIKVWNNSLRPDFSTGHLSRNWNQAIINGFQTILEPDCDILITCQDDVEFEKDYLKKIISYHENYNLIQLGKGDSFVSYTIDAIKKIGLWDERFCTIGFQEMDYYIRALKYNYERTSLNDYFHKKILNPIENHGIIKDTPNGFERKETYHKDSEIYFHVCSHLLSKKWTKFWGSIFMDHELRFDLEPQLDSFVYYPYFERYIETLKEQKFILQNDRIC